MKLKFTFRTIHYSWIYIDHPLKKGKFQYAMGDQITWLPNESIKPESYESKHRPKRVG